MPKTITYFGMNFIVIIDGNKTVGSIDSNNLTLAMFISDEQREKV